LGGPEAILSIGICLGVGGTEYFVGLELHEVAALEVRF
jgi:hypothetical protein